MKIMLDTNVLISAMIFDGKTGRLLEQLFDSDHELYVSDYVDSEFKEKLSLKWPDKADKVYSLFHRMDINFCDSTDHGEGELRDVKDLPVLYDALYHDVDMILTGDKDFLEADIERPLIYSPTMLEEFLNTYKP